MRSPPAEGFRDEPTDNGKPHKPKKASRNRWVLINHLIDEIIADLNRAEILVVNIMFRLANKDGEVYASVDFLAERAKTDPKRIRTALKHLQDLKVIRLVQKGSGRRANLYQFVFSKEP
jgi:hypothetical protein